MQRQGVGEPSVYHAVAVIFLEFFAWGLLTTPMLTVSDPGWDRLRSTRGHLGLARGKTLTRAFGVRGVETSM